MTKWTAGRRRAPVAQRRPDPRPARTCSPRAATTRSPAPGFMPGYVDVQKAFQDAFTAQIQAKTYDAGPVVDRDQGCHRQGPAASSHEPAGVYDRIDGVGRCRPRHADQEGAPMTAMHRRRAPQPAPPARDRRRSRAIPSSRCRCSCSWSSASARSSTPCSSASGDWNVRSGPVSSWGSSNYATAAHRSGLPARHPELALLRGRVGAADHGHRLFLAIIVNQKIRGQTFFRARSTSRRSPARPRSPSCGSSSSSPDGLFNSVRGGAAASTRSSSCFGYRAEPELDRRPGHGAELGDPPQRLDHLRARSCCSTSRRSSRSATRSTRRPRSTARAPGRRSGGSPSRCCGRATTSWRPSPSSVRCSCSTRRSSRAGPTATRTTR